MSKNKFRGDIKWTEKYTDKATGEEKKFYNKIGSLWEREDGSLYVNLAGGGFANVYEPKAKAEDYQKARQAVQATEPVNFDEGDEIPFAWALPLVAPLLLMLGIASGIV